MQETTFCISFNSVLRAFSAAMDLISKKVVGHHKQVAYLALMIGKELNFSDQQLQNLLAAALLHDVGVFYLNQNYDDLSFDNSDNQHAEVGYQLLKGYFHSSNIPETVRYHHLEWKDTKDGIYRGSRVPEEALVIFLADRITTLIQEHTYILNQVPEIEKQITDLSSIRFWPEAVKAFLRLSQHEYFWLNAVNNLYLERVLNNDFKMLNFPLGLEELISFCRLSSQIIDFRSPFTATHSSGVAITSEKMAELAGYDKQDCRLMKIAGYLHDIGKLAVPLSILNKSGKLTNEEWVIMKSHTYYTFQVLSEVKGMEKVREWSSYHHEYLDGKGYPFHLSEKELSLGARLMAVADVFTAVSEDRPYRNSMNKNQVINVLNKMARERKLDKTLVELLIDNYNIMDETRMAVQKRAANFFNEFRQKTIINSSRFIPYV